jgi:hypothetical protein
MIARELSTGPSQSSACFLPIQSGVGNIANAVLGALGKHPDMPAFETHSACFRNSNPRGGHVSSLRASLGAQVPRHHGAVQACRVQAVQVGKLDTPGVLGYDVAQE